MAPDTKERFATIGKVVKHPNLMASVQQGGNECGTHVTSAASN
jgi:hypothetical protein